MRKLSIGVDLGATNIRVAVGNRKRKILTRTERKTERTRSPREISQILVETIDSVISDFDLRKIKGIGVASAGILDPDVITVGGALVLNNKDLVVKPIREYLHEYAVNRIPKIEITQLGYDIVLYGTLVIVFQAEGLHN